MQHSSTQRILTVIPARGGSKGVPRKNIVIVNGCPLIEYTISVAMKVDGLTDVVVSTDDSEIAEISGGVTDLNSYPASPEDKKRWDKKNIIII